MAAKPDSDPLLRAGSFVSSNGPTPEKGKRKTPEPEMDWLPKGWSFEDRVRSSGATAGTTDRVSLLLLFISFPFPFPFRFSLLNCDWVELKLSHFVGLLICFVFGASIFRFNWMVMIESWKLGIFFYLSCFLALWVRLSGEYYYFFFVRCCAMQ